MNDLKLEVGQMMLVNAKGVKGGKVQLEFAQIVETGASSGNLLSLLNASDDRFGSSKPRRAWVSGEPIDIQKTFGYDVSGLGEGDVLEINALDPKVGGKSLNIEITETTEGSEYDVRNYETRAKRAGAGGDFILHEGAYIYQKLDVVARAASHKLFDDTTRAKEENISSVKDMLKDA